MYAAIILTVIIIIIIVIASGFSYKSQELFISDLNIINEPIRQTFHWINLDNATKRRMNI